MDFIGRLGGKELVGIHRKEGLDTRPDEYLARYQQLLERGISQTPKLYLDTNFWIGLRDAERESDDRAKRLLDLLRELIANKKVICVIQAASFLEIAKQSERSLLVISKLIEEFTESISIASQDELERLEAINYVRSKLDAEALPQYQIWTKTGLILYTNAVGHMSNLLPKSLDSYRANVLLKSMIDALWNAEISDILEAFGWNTAEKLAASIDQSTIEAIENRKKKRAEEIHSLQSIKQTEFESIMPIKYRKAFGRTVYQIAVETGQQIVFKELLDTAERLVGDAVRESVSGEIGRALPNTVIQTNLYCLYENDQNKKFSSNDWFDMCHASVALPYCDIFFTEKHLHHQICNVLKFDDLFSCEVIAGFEAAEAKLENML